MLYLTRFAAPDLDSCKELKEEIGCVYLITKIRVKAICLKE